MSTLKTNNIQHVDRSDPSIIINTDGSVNIAGTMTYEDVTNVDAVGIITGRDNINAQKQVHVGTGVSVKAGGINVTAGITTVQALQATTGTFSGDVDIADKIIHTGDTDTAIRFPAADSVRIDTAGSNRFKIDSNGRIGILDPNLDNFDSDADDLVINGAANTGITINSGGTTSTSEGNLVFAEGNGSGGSADGFRGAIQYKHGDDYMSFYTDNSERIRIDSSGRLMIGTTDVGGGNADDLTVATSGNTGITIRSGTSNTGNIFWSDATSGADQYIGALEYHHSDNKFKFNISNTTRMQVDSLVVNKL